MKLFILLIIFLITVRVNLYPTHEEDIKAVQEKIQTQQRELSSLEKEIIRFQKNLKLTSRKEKELNKKLKKSEGEINKKRRRLDKLRKNILNVKDEISNLNEKLLKERKEGVRYSSDIKKALKVYYFKQNAIRNLPWFAGYLSDIKNELFIYRKIVKSPAVRYTDVKREIERTSAIKKRTETKKKDLRKLKKEIVDVQNILIARRKEQLKTLKETRTRAEKQKVRLKQLKEEKNKLSALILSLKKKARDLERLKILAENFVAAKGNLPWPVKGNVISAYGRHKHPELDAVVFNRGINIRAKGVSRVVQSVAGGEVIYADSFSGMGNMVIIDHGKDYYTIYGGLKEIYVEIGESIVPFHKLGKLLNKDLYFEIGRGADHQDPLKWLEKKPGGGD